MPWFTPDAVKPLASDQSPYVSLKDYLNPACPQKSSTLPELMSRLTPAENHVNFHQLYAAHCHHGHARRHWHPRMSRFIIGHRAGEHIIDLEETSACMVRALKLAQGIIVSNGTILFVSTRRMMMPLGVQSAISCGQPYIVDKWVPGLISNFHTVFRSTQKHIQSMNDNPDKFVRSKGRLARRAAGTHSLVEPPDAIFMLNIKENQGAIREAQNANIPIIGVCDTDCNPEDIAYPIPANDDNLASVGFIAQTMATVIREAMQVKGRDIDLSFLTTEQTAKLSI